MASNSETGHAKNVAHFEDIVYIVTTYGESYNPSNPKLTVSELQNLHRQAEECITSVDTVLPTYKNAVSNRQQAFEGLSTKMTRIKNALEVSGASDHSIAQATTLVKKIRGDHSSPKSQGENGKEETKSKSTSQMSFDNRLSNYSSLVKFLTSIEEYRPNEPELQIQSLESELQMLKDKNREVMMAEVELDNIRIKRNNLLYAEDEGVYDRVSDVKTYVKSVYGSTSTQYKQLSKIKLTNH